MIADDAQGFAAAVASFGCAEVCRRSFALSGGLVVKTLRGQARLTEDNIADTLRQVRMALLEADVSLGVVKDFVERIRVGVIEGSAQLLLACRRIDEDDRGFDPWWFEPTSRRRS